jgi:hypothetical protein
MSCGQDTCRSGKGPVKVICNYGYDLCSIRAECMCYTLFVLSSCTSSSDGLVLSVLVNLILITGTSMVILPNFNLVWIWGGGRLILLPYHKNEIYFLLILIRSMLHVKNNFLVFKLKDWYADRQGNERVIKSPEKMLT